MKIKDWDFSVFGYLMLLVVNTFEVRTGIFLAFCQFILGLFVFYPQLNKNKSKTKSLFNTVLKVALLLSLVIGLCLNWYDAPNHLYLLTFLTLLMVFRPSMDGNIFLRENVRWILITLMIFATVHKFVHPHFINGDFIGFRTLTGSFFHLIHSLGITPEITEVLSDNMKRISQISYYDPSLRQKVYLRVPSDNFDIYVNAFVYIIAFTELLLTLLYIFIPYKKFTSIFLLIFVCSIGLVVSEFEFIATLLFMGIILCKQGDIKLNKLYRFSFIFYSGVAITYNLFQHLR